MSLNRGSIIKRLFIGLILGPLILFTVNSFAADPLPGSACSLNNARIRSGGPETSGVVYDMTCQGGVWVATMTMLANSNVGIGNTNPSGRLSISDSDSDTRIRLVNSSSTAARYPRINITNFGGTFGGAPMLVLSNGRGSEAVPAALASGDSLGAFTGQGYIDSSSAMEAARIQFEAEAAFSAANAPGVIRFFTNPVGSATGSWNYERMRLTSTGNLGIGTTSPSTKLDVNGSVNATSFISGLGAAGTPSHTFTGDTDTGWWSPAANTMAASTSGAEAMRIDSGGGVLIGTTSPFVAAKLDVQAIYTNSSNNGANITQRNTLTANGTYDPYAATVNSRLNIAAGVTASSGGGASFPDATTGLYVSALRNGISGYADSGTAADYVGYLSWYGHRNTGTGTPVTTNIYGMYLKPLAQTGTITNLYDLYINSTMGFTGGTVTNHWALYQNDTTANNFFAGNVGIGTTSPSARFDMSNSSNSTTSVSGARMNTSFNPSSAVTTSAVMSAA